MVMNIFVSKLHVAEFMTDTHLRQ